MPVYGNCDHCGAPISMPPSQWARSQEHFCSRQCHMAKMNAELNPTRMTKERSGRSWAARYSPVKSSTTSTATKETTDPKTFACSAAKPSTPGGTKKTTRRWCPMKFIPHEYQQKAIDRIVNNKRFGLFLEMGLG